MPSEVACQAVALCEGWRNLLILASLQKLALGFGYPGKLELWATGLLQDHLVAGNFQLINCSGERRLNFDSVLIAELVSAMHVSDEHNAIARKFPNRRIRTGHAPFANDVAISATGYRDQQKR
jgi:hypothetical protein